MKLEIANYSDRRFITSKSFEVINKEIPVKEYWFNNLRIYER
jgi:hypothetical protein